MTLADILKLLCKFPAYNYRLRSWFKLKERSARDWKVRSTKVDAGSECVKNGEMFVLIC